MARSPRPRRQRRQQERALGKAVRRTERLAADLPGGSRDNPLEVATSSLVEVKARGTTCVHCNGELELRGDRATSTSRGVLREIALVCRLCHAPRTLWFRSAPPASN